MTLKQRSPEATAAYLDGWAAGMRAAKEIAEAQRQKILTNPNDSSWAEHLAEVQNEIDARLNAASTFRELMK